MSDFEISHDEMLSDAFFKYSSYVARYRSARNKPSDRGTIRRFWICGPSGIAKSGAIARAWGTKLVPRPTMCSVKCPAHPQATQWMEPYENEEVLVLDEVRKNQFVLHGGLRPPYPPHPPCHAVTEDTYSNNSDTWNRNSWNPMI